MSEELPKGYRYLEDGEIITSDCIYLHCWERTWTSVSMAADEIGRPFDNKRLMPFAIPSITKEGNVYLRGDL